MTARSVVSFDIEELLDLGTMTAVQIASTLSVTPQSVRMVYYRLRSKGRDVHLRRDRRLEGRNEKIYELAEEGMMPAEIARELGLGRVVVIGVRWRAIKAGRIVVSNLVFKPTRNPFPDAGHCLYPSEHEPRDPEFSFCGRPTGSSQVAWCPPHRKIVYVRKPLPEE